MLDVVDGLLEQDADVAVVEGVDDPAPLRVADDEAEVAEQAELVGDGGCSIATASARSLTDQGESRSRARMRTRLGVASACIVCATSRAVPASIDAGLV